MHRVIASVEQVSDHMDHLLHCCLKEDRFTPKMITEVLHVADDADGYGYGTERDGVALVKLSDGRFAVITDGEDYTGHG